ncbi:MAG: hypothetical protein Q9227_008627 [Pyrenula ochraceoflavens]
MAIPRKAWQTLTDARSVMLGSLLMAIFFSISHHLFYTYLHGRDVSVAPFSQQTNLNAGTIFAFLVKAALAAAVGTAYNQVLWRTFLRRRLPVAAIDSLSSLPTSVIELLNWKRVPRHPILAALAVVLWALWVATAFPPGTLSVRLESVEGETKMIGPYLDWTRPIIFDESRTRAETYFDRDLSGKSHYTYNVVPRGIASSIATIAGLTGEIPLIPHLMPNSSYSAQFAGPALRCDPIQPKAREDVVLQCNIPQDDRGIREDHDYIGYMSWLSSTSSRSTNTMLSYLNNAPIPLVVSGWVDCTTLSSSHLWDATGISDDSFAIVIATQVSVDQKHEQVFNFTLCQLYNATYSVSFDFSGAQQRSNITTENFRPLQSISSYFPGHQLPTDSTSVTVDPAPATKRIYNYASMMMLFYQIVGGLVSSKRGDLALPAIMDTQLMMSNELTAFSNSIYDALLSNDTSAFSNTQPKQWSKIIGQRNGTFAGKAPSGPLATQLEELFQNLTVAMMSSPAISRDRIVNGRISHLQNKYIYTSQYLWLSYGIGLTIASLAVILGYYIAFENKASYTNRFSTYLRTIPWQDVHDLLTREAEGGTDPLPQRIAEAKIELGSSRPSGNSPQEKDITSVSLPRVDLGLASGTVGAQKPPSL